MTKIKITEHTFQHLPLTCLPALKDNYIWLLTDYKKSHKPTIVVDPGDSQAVINYLFLKQYTLEGILLTHHHYDHTDGITDLKKLSPDIPIFGPIETKIKGANQLLHDLQEFSLLDLTWQSIHTPGHTSGHLCYYSAPFLFSGDTLFSGGCGRLFVGTCKEMLDSFIKLYILPDDTWVCAAHEYTLQNLQFCSSTYNSNKAIEFSIEQIKALYDKGLPSLPSTIAKEKEINPYFNIINKNLKSKIPFKIDLETTRHEFCALRKLKDNF